MIKQPILFLVSIVLLFVVGGFVIERISFLSTAERAVGAVDRVEASNGRCSKKKSGKGKSRSYYDCTRYTAHIKFTTNRGQDAGMSLSAGSVSGHNQSITRASYRQGAPIPVVYNPNNPEKVYQDTIFGVWGAPIMAFIFQIVTFFGSMLQPKRRR